MPNELCFTQNITSALDVRHLEIYEVEKLLKIMKRSFPGDDNNPRCMFFTNVRMKLLKLCAIYLICRLVLVPYNNSGEEQLSLLYPKCLSQFIFQISDLGLYQ